jgi:RNA polymerase sigma-70 factor (ECF subfamily)
VDNQQQRDYLKRASAGDADALQCLILQHHAHLRAVITRQLDGTARWRLDPDDILQEVYLAIFRSGSKPKFEHVAQFTGWIESVALNATRSQLRHIRRQKRDIAREQRISRYARSSFPVLLDQLAATDSTPSRQLTRDEATAALLSSLARLTEDQRAVVRLRFLEGVPVTEVAQRLKMRDDAIHALTYRAITALRQHLGSLSRFLSGQ